AARIRIPVREKRELLAAEKAVQIETDHAVRADILLADPENAARLAHEIQKKVQRRELGLPLFPLRVGSVLREGVSEIDVESPEDRVTRAVRREKAPDQVSGVPVEVIQVPQVKLVELADRIGLGRADETPAARIDEKRRELTEAVQLHELSVQVLELREAGD